MQADKKGKSKRFRELIEQEKKKLIQSAKKKNKDGIIVIVQCHPKCKAYQDLPEFRYIVTPLDKIKEVDSKIKKKMGEMNRSLDKQSIFIFSQNRLLNRQTSFEDIFEKHKNFKDGVLYLFFANVDSF